MRESMRAAGRGVRESRCGSAGVVLALMLAAVALFAVSCAAPAKVHSDLELSGLAISAADTAAAGLEFTQQSAESLDVGAVGRTDKANEQRLADQILQGWDVYFESTDHRVELHVRLAEMSNHHWAETVRSKANAPTPEGFPPTTRMLVEEGDGAGRVGVNLVKGRIQVIVLTRSINGPALDRATVDALLAHVSTAQIARIPMLPDLTSTDRIDLSDIRAWLFGLQVTAVPALAMLLAAAASLRDVGALERYFPARLRSRQVTFYDLTPDVQLVRRHSRRRVGVQMLLATVFGVLALLIQLWLPGAALVKLAVIPVCFALAIVLDVVLRRHDTGEIPGTAGGRLPLIVGTVGAMVVLYIVAFWISSAIALGVLFTGPLFIKVGLVAIAVWLGLKALRYAAVPLRFAKRLAQPTVQQALRTDPRSEVLLLRSFQDDALTMRMHRSARHSPIELASAEPFERFEELLAWSLWRFGPVFAIGQPETDRELPPLGAAREFYDDDSWKDAVRLRMARSSMVVYVVGRSPGVYTEFLKAQHLGVLAKCLFVFPPVDYQELRARLSVLEAAFGLPQGALPPIDSNGRRLIGMYFGDDGHPITVGVDGRDDLAYQTLFTVAATLLIPRSDEKLCPAMGPGPDEPAAGVAAQLVRFDPRQSYTTAPTVGWGLKFIFLMATRRRGIQWQDA